MSIKTKIFAGVMSASMMLPVQGLADFQSFADFSAKAQAQLDLRRDSRPAEARMEMKENQDQRRERLCAVVKNTVQDRWERFESNRKRHTTAYVNIKTRVASLVAKADADGYDTTQLEAHAEILNDKIDKFASDYQAYLSALREARLAMCDEDADRVEALAEARALLKTAKASGQEARAYFKTVIKADIRALHAQVEVETEV